MPRTPLLLVGAAFGAMMALPLPKREEACLLGISFSSPQDDLYDLRLSRMEIRALVDQFVTRRHVENAFGATACGALVASDVLALTGTGIVGASAGLALCMGYIWNHLEQVGDGHISRRRFIDVPREVELALGVSAYLSLADKDDNDVVILPEDSTEHRRVVEVGKALTLANGFESTTKWTFVVVDDASANASVVPGGFVFVNTGLLRRLRTQDELAVVLAHEMAHVQARHAAERLSMDRFPQLLKFTYMVLAAMGIITPESVGLLIKGAQAIDLAGDVLLTLPFSRAMEEEADAMGMLIMSRACVPPIAAPQVWKKLNGDHHGDGGGESAVAKWLPSVLSTHPSPEQRETAAEELRPKMEREFERCCDGKGRVLWRAVT